MAQLAVLPRNMTPVQRKAFEIKQKANRQATVNPNALINQSSSVQKDALNLLNMVNAKKQTLINKFGGKRITDIANGLLALTKLSDNDIKNAESKNANLKLITIKAQEILKGDEDCLLGATKSLPVKKINTLDLKKAANDQIARAKKTMDDYLAMTKKFPKYQFAIDKYAQAKKNYENVVNTYKSMSNMKTISDFKNTIDPNTFQYTPVLPNKKISNPIKKTESTFMEQVQNYLPYIVIGAVVLILLFSQTKPRTPYQPIRR